MAWDMGGFSLGFDPRLDASFLDQYSSVPDYSYSIPDLQLNGGQMPAPSYSLGADTQLDASGISASPYSFGVSPLSFNPASVGVPAPGGPAPASIGPAPAMPSAPEPTPSPAAAVSNAAPVLGGAMGAGDQGKGGPATSVPGSGVGGGSAVAGRGYMPGSQSMSDAVRDMSMGGTLSYSSTPGMSGMASPAASIASTQGPASQPGAFSKFASGLGKDLLRSSMPALIGGGLNMLGSALAPKPAGPRQSPMSAPPIAPPSAPAPAPGPAPMSAPESAPLPGAKWSPLLMGNAPKMGNPNLGIETEKRMKKGKNTGGMALY